MNRAISTYHNWRISTRSTLNQAGGWTATMRPGEILVLHSPSPAPSIHQNMSALATTQPVRCFRLEWTQPINGTKKIAYSGGHIQRAYFPIRLFWHPRHMTENELRFILKVQNGGYLRCARTTMPASDSFL